MMGKVYLFLFTSVGHQNRFKIFRKLTFRRLSNEIKHLDCSSSHSHMYIFFFSVYVDIQNYMSTISIKLKIRMVNFPMFFFTSKFQYE